MTDTETYEGWTNRETWAVALHINNDQGWQESVLSDVRSVVSSDRDEEWMDIRAGRAIRENVEDRLDPEYQTSLTYLRELMTVQSDIGSLWRVNWDELGAAFLADLDES
jgi:hypothetical protein